MKLLYQLAAHNWTLKLAAFALALLLWTSVRVETPNRQVLPQVPVRIDLTDPQWALTGTPLPTSVQVRFAGPSRELFRMALDRPSIVIPVDRVHAGDTAIVLRSQWIRIQDRPGVTVEDIQPSSVRLQFEPIRRALLPVRVRLQGGLPPGLALAEPVEPDPPSVQVLGAASRLEGLDSVPLEVVDLSEIRSSGPVSVRVDTLRTQGLQVAPGVLSLRVVVEEEVERELSGVVLAWPGEEPPSGWEIPDEGPPVRVRGAASLVEALSDTELTLVADPDDVDRIRGLEETDDEGGVEVRLHVRGLPPFLQAEVGPLILRRPDPLES